MEKKRVKNEDKYQKEIKGREGNRICRKNKEGAGGGWSRIKKSAGRNETTDGEREKRGRGMEERR